LNNNRNFEKADPTKIEIKKPLFLRDDIDPVAERLN
jgi:hypothetical protein